MGATPLTGDWVAFNADGFPFGFANGKYVTTLKQAAREFPGAVELRFVHDGQERSRLLDIHAGRSAA